MSSASVSDSFDGEITCGVTFLDSHGHETTPDDTPQWSSDNDNVASVQGSDDGLTGTVTITGTPGAAVISVDTTNEDGSTVHSQGTLTVLPGDAVSGDITFEIPDEAAPPASEEDLPHPDNTLPGDLPPDEEGAPA